MYRKDPEHELQHPRWKSLNGPTRRYRGCECVRYEYPMPASCIPPFEEPESRVNEVSVAAQPVYSNCSHSNPDKIKSHANACCANRILSQSFLYSHQNHLNNKFSSNTSTNKLQQNSHGFSLLREEPVIEHSQVTIEIETSSIRDHNKKNAGMSQKYRQRRKRTLEYQRFASDDHDADDEGSLGEEISRSSQDSDNEIHTGGPVFSRSSARTGLDINRNKFSVPSSQVEVGLENMERVKKSLKKLLVPRKSNGQFSNHGAEKIPVSPHKRIEYVKKVAMDITRTLSRSRGRGGNKPSLAVAHNDSVTKLSCSGVSEQEYRHPPHINREKSSPMIRAVSNQSLNTKNSPVPSQGSTAESIETANTKSDKNTPLESDQGLGSTASHTSWEEHLRRDLNLRHRSSKRGDHKVGFRHTTTSNKRVELPEIAAVNHRNQSSSNAGTEALLRTPTKTRVRPEPETSAVTRTPASVCSIAVTEIDDTPQRMPCSTTPSSSSYSRLSSSSQSFRVVAPSTTPSMSWPLLPEDGERMGDILPSGESDPFVNNDDVHEWGKRYATGLSNNSSDHTLFRQLNLHPHGLRKFSTLENFSGVECPVVVSRSLELCQSRSETNLDHPFALPALLDSGHEGSGGRPTPLSIHPLTTRLIHGLNLRQGDEV